MILKVEKAFSLTWGLLRGQRRLASCPADNFGDRLSPFIASRLSGRKVFCEYDKNKFPYFGGRLIGLGSILEKVASDGDTVWGAGARGIDWFSTIKRLDVKAVRGPLTRAAILKKNLECPEVYGDPAILIPYLFRIPLRKIYKIGIIPHFNDQSKYAGFPAKDVKIIDVKADPLQVLRDICDCEVILSSALHGIIVAEAYGIPTCWLWPDAAAGPQWKETFFKYEDYYLSTSRDPFYYAHRGEIDLDQAVKRAWDSKRPQSNPQKLLEAFPYLRKDIRGLDDLLR